MSETDGGAGGLSPKTLVAVVALVSTLGGGGLGTLAGGARAEEKLADQDKRLAVIESKVDGIADQVKANAEEVVKARKDNKETVERIHKIDKDTTKILTILEERDG